MKFKKKNKKNGNIRTVLYLSPKVNDMLVEAAAGLDRRSRIWLAENIINTRIATILKEIKKRQED